MPSHNFFNEVAELVVGRMEAQVEAILQVYPLPPGWEEMHRLREVRAQWNKMSQAQRAAWVRQVGGPVEAMKALGMPVGGG